MAISGRVLAPDGQPVPDTFVTALRAPRSPRRAFDFVSAQPRSVTNEHGEYRLDGLSAGEFFLIVLPRNPDADAQGRPKHAGFGNTFHPGVQGQEVTGLEVVIARDRPRR